MNDTQYEQLQAIERKNGRVSVMDYLTVMSGIDDENVIMAGVTCNNLEDFHGVMTEAKRQERPKERRANRP